MAVVGQNLARDLCVLETLIDLYKYATLHVMIASGGYVHIVYRQLHPNENKLQYTSEDIGLTEDAKLWISVSSALCTAANNPQNGNTVGTVYTLHVLKLWVFICRTQSEHVFSDSTGSAEHICIHYDIPD